MTGDALDPLAAVRADAAALDALASCASPADDDPALGLLAALRLEIDAAVAETIDPDVRRDTALLDALASGAMVRDPAVGLLGALRAAVDGVTVPAVAVTEPLGKPVGEPRPAPAAAPPVAVPVSLASRRRRRVLRTGVAAGSVALALSMSGVAAAAYDSHPGGSLYGLRTQTFGRTDDDPVAAADALAELQKQAAAAVSKPDDPSVVAKVRAEVTHFQHLVAAEHNPRAQQSFAASASSVETTVAALPVPVASVSTRSAHPASSQVAGRQSSVHTASPRAVANVRATASDLPAPLVTPPVAPREPEASPAGTATPSPSGTADPTGTPTTTDSPGGSASPSSSVGGSPDPSATSTPETPSDSASASATAKPILSPSDVATTLRTAPAQRVSVPAKSAKPKAKPVRKKKPVTATLMTAQLPTSGVTQR